MTPAEHGQERHRASRERSRATGEGAFCSRCSRYLKRGECECDRRERALVEAGNNVISDLERQGSVTSAHYNALRAALDRIQEGR